MLENTLKTESIQAVNPATGKPFGPKFPVATKAELDKAVAEAAAVHHFRRDHSRRSRFLRAIATNLEASSGELVACANSETALPMARLEGELARTTKQLRMFADVVDRGDWLGVIIVKEPLDIRKMMQPIGPIAVFGASNFPFAFSVSGGDTASAFAAGCPVIAKAHPAHPGTSELTAEAIRMAAAENGVEPGVFALLQGGADLARELCLHPLLEGVAFTGSYRAGRALFDLAASRPRPIPVFAEMGSINPVFVLPGALAGDSEKLAEGYAASLCLGVGQFCTNPGLLVGFGPDFGELLDQIDQKLAGVTTGTMLTNQIQDGYLTGLQERSAALGLQIPTSANPVLFRISSKRFKAEPRWSDELFGPSAVAVTCSSFEDLLELANLLSGQLTATIQMADRDVDSAQTLLDILREKVGRVVVNGFPTGVEVCESMQHGGPYPATTDSRFTSVGTAAISRFLRPVAFQNLPPLLMPEELRG